MTPRGWAAVQIAIHWGARVIACAHSLEDVARLKEISLISHIIDLSDDSLLFVDNVVSATGGLGVDCVIDCGSAVIPKHDLVSVLAMGGKWVSSVKHFDVRFGPCRDYSRN